LPISKTECHRIANAEVRANGITRRPAPSNDPREGCTVSHPPLVTQHPPKAPRLTEGPLRVLIIENDPNDAELCILALRQDGLEVNPDVVQTAEEFRTRLSSKVYDVILADYTLPGWTGMDALKHVQQERCDVPFIIVTGTLGEEAAIACIKAGASDCVLKGRLPRLSVAVRRALEEKSLREERTRAEQALKASLERYRLLFERNLAGVYSVALDGRMLDLNEACARMFGYTSRERAMAHTLWEVAPNVAEMQMLIALVQKQKGFTDLEVRLRRIDGRPLWVLGSASLIEGEDGKPAAIEGTLIDITERKRLEEQLRQSAKMEAVGRLAGGVAHDFNNLLTAILGYSDLLLERLPGNSQLSRYAGEVKKAGERASSLTRQLLAFSRQQVLAPQVLNLNTVVADMQKMLRRLIGEDIELMTSLEPQLGNVKADPGQIEQVILNLAVNSRDAMPQGGTLTIETANLELNDGRDLMVFEQPSVRAGKYVMLAISDTGCGMDAETQTHIFEPFFTTKGKDKGTGLGLSTVYGIVKQSEGYISVRSEPGQGATLKVYLPCVKQESAEVKPREPPSTARQGSETILLVEDEDAVRELARVVLLAKGYKVLEAASGEEALKICEKHVGPIPLLVTDVIMPHISGQELARHVAALRPETKVLYMSGHTGGAIGRPEISDSESPFLQKPFSSETLTRKVRDMLDAG
jgi:two-component system cell cycle sensor histidine kinase/response regulator CckA